MTIRPKPADIGRKVIYTGNRYPGGKVEEGVITSFNDYSVFVRYGADSQSKGTNRKDLEWLGEWAEPGAHSANLSAPQRKVENHD